MRTTLNINDNLLKQARMLAADSGRTLSDIVQDALIDALSRNQQRATSAELNLPVFNGTGVLPGVDLTNSASLLDLMEESE